MIDNKHVEVYVGDGSGSGFYLIPVVTVGGKYVRAKADETLKNNLLELPEF